MSMQDFSSAPARNPSRSAAIPSKVSVGKGGAPMPGTVNGKSSGAHLGSPNGPLAKAPAGHGADLGGAITGFGSGKPDASTVNAVGGKLAKSPQAAGSSVRGFAGAIKPGKI